MNRLIKYIILAFIAISTLGLAGCEKKQGKKSARHDKEKLEVVSIDKVSGSMEEGWTVTMTVQNNTLHTIRITSASLFLLHNNKKIARIALSGEVLLPRRNTTQVEVPLRATLSSPLTAIGALNKIIQGNFDGFTVNYDATFSTRLMKNISFTEEGITLKELIGSLNMKQK